MTHLASALPSDTERSTPALPVIFLGPSMSLAEARARLTADYRPPVRRGDLDAIEPGKLVAIIDGMFGQELAVSPSEICAALARGVRIVGGSSMGALRAAEVPGMIGVGCIYEWYRTGKIDRDDEVALIFDPRSGRPLSVALVNVRHALDRLTALGTIGATAADAILEVARRLSFKDRTYPQILVEAGFVVHAEVSELVPMFETHDLKRADAQAVIEWVDRYLRDEPTAADP